MDSAIRRTLWGAFAALTALIALGLALALYVLQASKQQEYRIVHGSESLLDAVQQMDEYVLCIMGAVRGYLLTQQTQFEQQYDDGVRDFLKQSAAAAQTSASAADQRLIGQPRQEFAGVRYLSDRAIMPAKQYQPGAASNLMPAVTAARRKCAARRDELARRPVAPPKPMNDPQRIGHDGRPSLTGRISTVPVRPRGMRAAIPIASSRSFARMRK